MVKVRDDLPKSKTGAIDLEAWVQHLIKSKNLNKETVLKAAQFSLERGGHLLTPYQDSCFRYGLTIAEILMSLEPDADTIVTALLYHTVYFGGASLDEIENHFGKTVSSLVDGLSQIDTTQSKQIQSTVKKGYAFTASNPDNLRRMLLAVVKDLRVVLIKLAERIAALRSASNLPERVRLHIAKEAHQIYSPLANRLGIGQIKWEIEDLAFRYMEPIDYKQIAGSLDEKRLAREKYIQQLIVDIQQALIKEGIESQVQGRVKHIYSIWRKMQRKHLSFSEIYDVRAVRILVKELKDCYAVLGIIHSMWQHIPKEFDDYIATPKENGYRSLHTAVIGPSGKTVEIQIRTEQMHTDAELGVAAHWVYKEGGQLDAEYQSKLNSIRSLLEEGDAMGDAQETEKFLQCAMENERVYVFSPAGDVIDLPYGATSLDFAFHIHTELGYRCRGAKVNNKMVPLTYQLKSGEQVDILTVKEGGPSRDWLMPSLGYLKSSKSRAKVKSWFRRQDRSKNIEQGKELLEKELKRLHLTAVSLSKLAHDLHFKNTDDLFFAVGVGDVRLAQVLGAIQRDVFIEQQESVDHEVTTKHIPKHKTSNVEVAGIGGLKSSFAKCCKPVPGDAIVGFVTIGRGVSVHRKDCMNVLDPNTEQRMLDVHWARAELSVFPVDIEIIAYDRAGLLNDITSILSSEKVNVIASSSSTNHAQSTAKIILTVQVNHLEILGRVLNMIMQIPNVIEAHRVVIGASK